MAALQVRPATILDVPAIAKVHERALEKFHDFYAAFYKNHPVESLPKSTFAAVNNPANIFLIALDGEAIVGFLRYHIADTVEEKKAVGLEGESVQAQAQPQPDFYERKDSLKELWTEFNADDDEKDALYDGTVKGKRHIYIKSLMIDPEFQRRGIGGRLLAEVLTLCDREQIPAFIIASAEALGLYKRVGFQELRSWVIDNELWARKLTKVLGQESEGLVGKYTGVQELEVYMVRWPISR